MRARVRAASRFARGAKSTRRPRARPREVGELRRAWSPDQRSKIRALERAAGSALCLSAGSDIARERYIYHTVGACVRSFRSVVGRPDTGHFLAAAGSASSRRIHAATPGAPRPAQPWGRDRSSHARTRGESSRLATRGPPSRSRRASLAARMRVRERRR